MGFFATLLGVSAAAVSVPLILHFFYRARFRRLDWAAMDFLRQAIEQTSRRLRFQEYVLLALRCAIMLLLALALTFALVKPDRRWAAAAGRGQSVDAVFVFDVSLSMSARDGDKTRMDRAKDAALAVIDHLPANSTVQIYSVADRAAFLGPITPGNLDQARQTVLGVEPTSLSTDLLPGLTEAFAALERGAGSEKEVYLFGDMQKAGWDRQSAGVRAKCEEIRQRATLLLVRCGSADRLPRNVSVTDIVYPGGIPHTGTRMPFTVLLKNAGREPVKNLTVTLEVDGKSPEKEGEQVEEVGPGQTFPVTLTAKLDDAGPRVITARVKSDDVPGDDRLDRVIVVREQLRVVIVDGAPDTRDPKDAGSHFIRNSLLPVAENQIDDYFVRVTVVPPEEAGPGLLGTCDVCILANVPASNADIPGVAGLSPAFVTRLAEFVSAGGGLVIGGGDRIVPGRYNAVFGKLLPFPLEAPHQTTQDKPFRLAPETADGYLARFRDEPFRTVTADADVFAFLGMTPAADPATRVLLAASESRPFVVSRIVGEGEVVFVAGSFDTRWGNWPAKAGSFLSFTQFTLSHLTGKAGRGTNRIAGEPLVHRPTDGATGNFDLIRPDNRRVKLGKPTGERPTVTATDTSVAGVYRVVADGQDEAKATRYAVAPDPREADALDPATDAEVEELLGFKPEFLQAGEVASAESGGNRGRVLWLVLMPWVLLGVFGVAVVESVWAWVCGRAW